jgi:hypothetical protein
MVLTDREQVINIARNHDEESLNLDDEAKLFEIVDEAIIQGQGSANAWATSIKWSESAALTHPLYPLYHEIYLIYAAMNVIMRLPDVEKDLTTLQSMIAIKGPLLTKGVKEMATLGTDGGTSKVRASLSIADDITYPKNLAATPYYSVGILKGRRGRQ